jgi:hypothetical protein
MARDEKCKKHGGRGDGTRCAEPNWSATCEVCGAKPTVCCTGLCGPCAFGEADTVGGNW